MKILAFFLAWLAAAGGLWAVHEIDEASAFNLALASSLLGAENACNASLKEATIADPFKAASMDIVSLVPQAGNITSDLSNPSLIWSWSASYPQSLSLLLSGPAACPSGSEEIYSPQAWLEDAKLAYSYGSCIREVALGSDGPNPVQLNLSAGCLGEYDLGSLYVLLHASLSGTIFLKYNYRKTEYSYKCVGATCFCQSISASGSRLYSKALSSSRDFLVEAGENDFMWLNPPLGSRLEGRQKAQVLLFARRMPSFISASAEGNHLGSSSLFSFSFAQGRCGEKQVVYSFSPQKSGLEALLGNESSALWLTAQNASYLPILAEFEWESSPGKKNASIGVQDWFSHSWNYSQSFAVRAPSPYSSLGLSARAADETKTSAFWLGQMPSGIFSSPHSFAVAFPALFAAGLAALLLRAKGRQG
jgi:hypothetical protein